MSCTACCWQPSLVEHGKYMFAVCPQNIKDATVSRHRPCVTLLSGGEHPQDFTVMVMIVSSLPMLSVQRTELGQCSTMVCTGTNLPL